LNRNEIDKEIDDLMLLLDAANLGYNEYEEFLVLVWIKIN